MLQNKTILITGSSRGIGPAIARKAQEYRATVIVHGKQDSDELRTLAKELNCRTVIFDVSDVVATQHEIAALGVIDILVNNAGINPSKTFMQLEMNDWKEIFETNVFGLVNCSRAVIPGMIERMSGKIINIASIKALNTVSGKPAYAASKAAVMRITSSMAEEFAPQGILVNAVAPGFTETEMTQAELSQDKRRFYDDHCPVGRVGQVSDVAAAVLYLAGPNGSFINGQEIGVTGGLDWFR